MMARINRLAPLIQWSSIGLILLAILLMVRILPVNRGLEALRAWVEDLSFWGPLIVGGAYVIGALLFLPGSALSLASGAMFGLLWGTITVSIASTVAAGLAFLIARYFARAKVERQANRYPKFQAIDQAIGKEGWKIIALLRLSPIVPFSLSNYLYGLTAVRLGPYILASWIAMLPGTFMYIYFGNLGREGLSAAAGAQSAKSPAQWAMMVIGLLATVAVTVYVTRVASRAVKERTQLNEAAGGPEPAASHSTNGNEEVHPASPSWPWGATLSALLALLMLTTATYAYVKRDMILGFFGPPGVTLREVYDARGGGSTFAHSLWSDVLKKYVNEKGLVNYAALHENSDELDRYISSLATAPFRTMGRNEKLAFLINAYNACTLRLILDYYPIDSIRDIPASKRWNARRWHIAGQTWSLNQIEHEQIRPKFREPRVHFALVCAAMGCPRLRNEAYRADRIDQQLDDQANDVHSHSRWLRFDPDRNVLSLTKLYKWYGSDFKQVGGSVPAYAARYVPRLKQAMASGHTPPIQWLDYDWKLNSQ